MTQTATSAKGHGAVIHAHGYSEPGETTYSVGKAIVYLWIDGAYVSEETSAAAARAKAAELTEDPYLKWETHP